MHSASLPYRGRFAPSPTGPLHFGSLVAAVASYLQARARGGVWLVRMEDLDPPREVPGAAAAILDALAAFGLVSDEPVWFQSTRAEAYRAALAQLQQRGHLYPCACSRRNLPRSGVYAGTCRQGLPEGGKARSWRVRTDATYLGFTDTLQGAFGQQLDSAVGDFVVRRTDAITAYHLAVVVDDAAQGITEIVRGADLLEATPRQIHLQRLLGLPTPGYAHLPVAVDDRGNKLSKQTRALPVDRSDPVPALRAALAFLGHPPPGSAKKATLKTLWRFAQDNWRLDRVPAVRRIPVPQQS